VQVSTDSEKGLARPVWEYVPPHPTPLQLVREFVCANLGVSCRCVKCVWYRLIRGFLCALGWQEGVPLFLDVCGVVCASEKYIALYCAIFQALYTPDLPPPARISSSNLNVGWNMMYAPLLQI